MIAETDYYAVLEIPRNASDAQIREAYRLQSLAWHPDRFPEGKLRDRANERMAEINAAYEYLRGKSANSGSERIVSLADVTGRRQMRRPPASSPSPKPPPIAKSPSVGGSAAVSVATRRNGTPIMLSVAAAMVVLPFLIVLVLARADYPIFKQLIAPNRPLPNYAVPHSAAQAHVHVSHFDPSIRYVFAQSSPRGNAREPNVAASPKMAAVRDERRVPAQPMAGLWAASGNGVGHSGEMSLSQLQSAVSSGADVNARNTVGETALMWAASTGKLDVVEFLVSHGANVNVADNKGQTALMGAANAGNLDCEAYLMSNGAEINAKDAKGWTPLMNAAISGNLDCVDALIKCGADVNVRSDAGVTAMTCAQYKRSQPEIAALQAAGAAG